MKLSIVFAALALLSLTLSCCSPTEQKNAATDVAAGAATGDISAQQAQQYYGPAN